MKKLIIIISLIASIFTISTFDTSAQTKKDRDQVQVTVEGLGCPFCAYGLEKKFQELKGIKNVQIEMETGIMTFDFPADKAIAIETIETQVDKAGYTAIATEITRYDGTIINANQEEKPHIELTEEAIIENTFAVSGNCDMCKSRIEKTASNIEGIRLAEWDKESKMLKIEYDTTLVTLQNIQERIATVGHDTESAFAPDSVYQKLPMCCQYERKEK